MESDKHGLISPLKPPILAQLVEGILPHSHLRMQPTLHAGGCTIIQLYPLQSIHVGVEGLTSTCSTALCPSDYTYL